ncbi:MAG: hypothetical protein KDI15_12220 [Thiothrix sp.]|nr:hypothetical protein [Thiothrix sp.]
MNQLPRPTRESLQQSSHAELVELVLMLFDRIDQLTARVKELEAQVNKDSKNSVAAQSDRIVFLLGMLNVSGLDPEQKIETTEILHVLPPYCRHWCWSDWPNAYRPDSGQY